MTRIFTEGFEMGDMLSCNIVNDISYSGFGIQSTRVRSGKYASYSDSGGTDPSNNITKTLSSETELYVRFGWRPLELTGPGKLLFSVNKLVEDLVSIYFYAQDGGYIEAYVHGVKVSTSAIVRFTPGIYYLIETHIIVSEVNGLIEIRKNGILIFSYSGDTTGAVGSSINYCSILRGDQAFDIDDIAINDTTGIEDNSWCGNGYIIAIKPNYHGDRSDLLGSDGDTTFNYLLVDETPHDGDNTYVEGDNVGEYDLYNLTPSYLHSSEHKIKRAWVEARAKGPVNGRQMRLMLKTDGAEYEGSAESLVTTYAPYKSVYLVNPLSGLPWTPANIDGSQVGMKIS